MIILVKILLLVTTIASLTQLIQNLFLLKITVDNKGKVNDDGKGRMVLTLMFAVSTAVLVCIW